VPRGTWAVCSLLHFPWAHAPQALPGTRSAGARTFLRSRHRWRSQRLPGRLSRATIRARALKSNVLAMRKPGDESGHALVLGRAPVARAGRAAGDGTARHERARPSALRAGHLTAHL